MKQDNDGDVINCSAATDIPIGVAVRGRVCGATGGLLFHRDECEDQGQGKHVPRSPTPPLWGRIASGRLVAKTTSGDYAVGFAVGDIKAGEIGEVIVAPHEVA